MVSLDLPPAALGNHLAEFYRPLEWADMGGNAGPIDGERMRLRTSA
jgi:hypothetical protein